MSSSGFSARASLYRDLRSGSRPRSDSPVSFPPPAPPVGPSPSGSLAVAFSDLGLGVGASAVQDSSGLALGARAGGSTSDMGGGGDFVSIPPGRSFGDQFLADTGTTTDPGASVESRESFSFGGGLSDSELLAATLRAEARYPGDTRESVGVAMKSDFVREQSSSGFQATTTKPSTVRDKSSFVDYGLAASATTETRGVKFQPDVKSKLTNGEPLTSNTSVVELQNSVSLVAVDLQAEVYCGAVVGVAGKFCLYPAGKCPKKSHRKAPSFLGNLRDQGMKECLFICVPVPKGSSQGTPPTLAFQDPFLDSARLSRSKVQEMAQAHKPVWLWSSMFAMLSGEVQGKTAAALNGSGGAFPDTPLRHRTLDQIQEDATQTAFTPARHLELEDVEIPSPVSEGNELEDVDGEWHQAQEEKKIDPALLEAIRETQSLHGASFQRMYDSIHALNSKVQDIKTEALHSSRKEVVALITAEVNKVIWAELSKASPTLKVAEKFFLRGGLSDFEHHIRKTTADAVAAAGGNNGQSSLFNLSQPELEDVKKLIVKLQEDGEQNKMRLIDLEARTESYSVEVEGFQFASLSQVAAFVSSHGIAPGVLKFCDAISLMEKLTTGSQSYAENVDAHYRGQRSNMESPSDQKVVYSFQLVAPTALAGTPDQARVNPRNLSKMETYQKFKGSGARDAGAANTIRKMIADKCPALLAEVENSTMSRDAKVIARFLLSESRSFLDSLFIFMKDQVEDYGSDTNLSEVRRWDLVQNITRIVFEVISQPRRTCSKITLNQATSPKRAPELLWAVLQAHRLQKEFLDHNFKNHPKVGPMLTHFLLDVVSFHDDVNPIVDDVKKALSDAQQAKRKVDAVESQVKNLQSRLPSKKSKPNEQQ